MSDSEQVRPRVSLVPEPLARFASCANAALLIFINKLLLANEGLHLDVHFVDLNARHRVVWDVEVHCERTQLFVKQLVNHHLVLKRKREVQLTRLTTSEVVHAPLNSPFCLVEVRKVRQFARRGF